MDAMEFFRRSAGLWRSQRTTHHLAFKRSELGESQIRVSVLLADDPAIIALCQLHQIDPEEAMGGCCVSWEGSLSWDNNGENHDGKTVFALVPDRENSRCGRLLRDFGYAEIVPVVGQYAVDEADALVLSTEYETMSSVERFWFAHPDVRVRTSVLKRWGGFSTASLCTEIRVDPEQSSSDQLISRETKATAPRNALELKPSTSKQVFSLLGW
jgi:hypothetical protein